MFEIFIADIIGCWDLNVIDEHVKPIWTYIDALAVKQCGFV